MFKRNKPSMSMLVINKKISFKVFLTTHSLLGHSEVVQKICSYYSYLELCDAMIIIHTYLNIQLGIY